MFEDDDDDLECDCMEEEVDLLDGRARCWRCGSSRWLSSEELTRRLKLEAKIQAYYDRYCGKIDQEEPAPPSETFDESEIPF